MEYRPGTALLYRMDTFHRGTPLRPGARRLTHHLVVKQAAAEWMGRHVHNTSNPFPVMCGRFRHLLFSSCRAVRIDSNNFVGGLCSRPEFVAKLSAWQRKALGIPLPSDPYWNAETVALLQQRYPALDASEYEAGAARAVAKL